MQLFTTDRALGRNVTIIESKGVILASELRVSIPKGRLHDEITELRKIVFDKLETEAGLEGANAVVGIKVETTAVVTGQYEVIGGGNQRRANEFMVEIAATGNAVTIAVNN